MKWSHLFDRLDWTVQTCREELRRAGTGRDGINKALVYIMYTLDERENLKQDSSFYEKILGVEVRDEERTSKHKHRLTFACLLACRMQIFLSLCLCLVR